MGKLLYVCSWLTIGTIALSGCSGNSSSNSPSVNGCTRFVSGARLVNISPSQGTLFGDQRVTAVLSGTIAGFTPSTVYLGTMARDVITTGQTSGMTISFTTAGTPTAGMYPLVLANDFSTCAYFGNAYQYVALASPYFRRFVAMGASYTAGFQSDSYNETAQLNGPATWIARQAGAYFPIPLIRMPGIPPEPGFAGLDITGQLTLNLSSTINDILGAITNPQTGTLDIPAIFEDPSVRAYNIAIPGATIEDEVLGAASTTDRVEGIILLSNLLFNPFNQNPFETAEVEPETVMAQQLGPSLIVSTDLYGNDLITDNTTLQAFTLYITQAVAALASTGAQVFLADVPHISMFPSAQQDALNALAACHETFGTISLQTLDAAASAGNQYSCTSFTTDTCQQNACAALAVTNKRIDQFNAEFATAVAPYPNIHIVPFSSLVNGGVSISGQSISFDPNGFPQYTINGITLRMRHLGGFYSLDDLHLTNTGYAILASVFIQTINTTLGTQIPLPDLPSILAGDPLSPPAIGAYCGQAGNSEKLYCQCIDGPGDYVSVTSFTCSSLLY